MGKLITVEFDAQKRADNYWEAMRNENQDPEARPDDLDAIRKQSADATHQRLRASGHYDISIVDSQDDTILQEEDIDDIHNMLRASEHYDICQVIINILMEDI